MRDRTVIGIGCFAVARSGVLTTFALGSCVGICLYDSANRTGGLVHALLPDSEPFVRSGKYVREDCGKYVDTALSEVLSHMCAAGAKMENIKARIYGGAEMFSLGVLPEFGHIGARNTAAAAETLAKYGIPLVAKDIGGTIARTIIFHIDDGRVEVTMRGKLADL